MPGGMPSDIVATIAIAQSVWQVLSGLWTPATATMAGGALLSGGLGLAMSRSRWRDLAGTAVAAAYVIFVLLLVAGLQLLSGGAGSSMTRFTDFANPLGIALGVLILGAAWKADLSGRRRGVLAVSIAMTTCVAMLIGSSSVFALGWRPSAAFLVGKSSYADMNEEAWETLTAYRIARSLPAGAKVDTLTFHPGFTAVPDNPFQRPDGAVYLKDYTKILFGPPELASAIYANAGVNYFLVDLSTDSAVLWNGFAPLFAPDAIRERMRLVAHVSTKRRELYLLTWRQEGGGDGVPEAFLELWSDKLERDKASAYFYGSYVEGRRRLGSRQ